MSVRLLLIRHAESTYNQKSDIVCGQNNDCPLSIRGEGQSRLLGHRIRGMRLQIDEIHTSTAIRAITTANIAKTIFMPGIPLVSVPELLEQSQGDFEGRPRSEVHTKEILDLMSLHKYDYSPPNGESLRDVESRCLPYILQQVERLKALSEKDLREYVIAIFAHGGMIRSAIRGLMQSNSNDAWLIGQNNTGITEFRFDDQGISVIRINDYSHLE